MSDLGFSILQGSWIQHSLGNEGSASAPWCKGWLSIWGCLHKAKSWLSVTLIHAVLVPAWPQKPEQGQADQLPLPSVCQGDRTATVWKATGEGGCAHSSCEPGSQQRGCLEPCTSANHCDYRAATCHAQHSCSGLNSITGLFWAHGLATCSVSRSGSCWPSFTPLLDVRACEPFLLLFSAN